MKKWKKIFLVYFMFCLRWVFIDPLGDPSAAWGFSLVVVSGGSSPLQ